MRTSWFGTLPLATDPHATARRAWYRFYQTGRQLLAGDLTAIYRMASDSRYFWLYPPYCIYLAAPLGVLPEWYAYALCVLVEVAAVGGALAVLRAAVPGRGADHTNAAIAVLASMPFNTAIVIGQISGVLSLILAASLWAWRRRRPVTTGLLLSLLFIKPNLAIFFPLVCLLARQWRVVPGIGVGSAFLLPPLLSLGFRRWRCHSVRTHGFGYHLPNVVRRSK